MQDYSQEYIDKIWIQIIEDAQDIIEREALLEDLIDDVLLKSNSIQEAVSKRIARKLGQNAIYEENLRKLFLKVLNKDKSMQEKIIANIVEISQKDKHYNSPVKVILYSRQFQMDSANVIIDFLLENGKEDIALYVKGLSIV